MDNIEDLTGHERVKDFLTAVMEDANEGKVRFDKVTLNRGVFENTVTLTMTKVCVL